MYALLTGSPSYLSLSSLTATSILKLVNSSVTWRNKLPFIAIFPGIICICFTYLSSLSHSNLPSTALSLIILLLLEFCKLAYTEFYKPGYIAQYPGTVARTFLYITVYPRHGVIEPMRIRIYSKDSATVTHSTKLWKSG